MSNKIRSGRWSRAACKPSSPSATLTTLYPARTRALSLASRMNLLSSINSIFMQARASVARCLIRAAILEGRARESALVLDRLTSDATLALNGFSTSVSVTQVIGIDPLHDRDTQLGRWDARPPTPTLFQFQNALLNYSTLPESREK